MSIRPKYNPVRSEKSNSDRGGSSVLVSAVQHTETASNGPSTCLLCCQNQSSRSGQDRCYVSPDSLGDAEGGIIGGLVYVGAVAATGLVIVSGGGLAAAIMAAVLAGGAGGLVGTVLAGVLEAVHALQIRDHLELGGLVLWVRTWTPEDEERATTILRKHSGKDVHVHGTPTS